MEKYIIKAKYKCRNCGHNWVQRAGPTECPRCGHLFVDWVNHPINKERKNNKAP